MKAQTTDSGKKNPAAFPALIAAILTFGATPTMPMVFFAAAIVPAVCVPCPLSSFQALGAVFGTPPTHDTLFEKSTFGLRRVDLPHVPLERRQVVGSGSRSVRYGGVGLVKLRVVDRGSESAGGSRTFDLLVLLDVGRERVAARGRNDDSDRVVAVRQCAAGGLYRLRRIRRHR